MAALITVLLKAYGETLPQDASQFQEECCGQGSLSAGVRFYGFVAGRRDAPWLQKHLP